MIFTRAGIVAFSPIEKLSKTFLSNPKRIEVNRAASANENITAFKINVKSRAKRETLRWLLQHDQVETAIIFANRKTTEIWTSPTG